MTDGKTGAVDFGQAAGPNGDARKSGVALWRQIADQIRRAVSAGGSATASCRRRWCQTLRGQPPHAAQRHYQRWGTESMLRAGKARAPSSKPAKLSCPISARTRFFDRAAQSDPRRAQQQLGMLSEGQRPGAWPRTWPCRGRAAVRLETLSEADERPVSSTTSWFDAERFPGYAEAYAETGSITLAFQRYGVEDYFRKSTVSARRRAADLLDLKLMAGAIVPRCGCRQCRCRGRAGQYAETRFVADRVELSVSTEA